MVNKVHGVPLDNAALEMANGGSTVGDVIKGAVHYGALGLGHLMDADTTNSPYHVAIPAFVDRMMDKVL